MTELSPEAKALLRQARGAFSPSEGRLSAVRAALESQMVASQGASASPSAASGVGARAAGVTGWTVAHTVGTALLIGVFGAGGLAVGNGWRPAFPSRQALVATEAPSMQTVPPANDLPNDGKPRDDVPPALRTAEGAAPTAMTAFPVVPLRERASDPRASRVPHRARSKAEAPRDPPVDPATNHGAPTLPSTVAITTPAPMTPAPTSAPFAPVPAPTPVSVAPLVTPVEGADSLAEEVRMLRDARAALDRGETTRAIALLDAHASRFPRGTLYEERLAARVQTLCAMGRIDVARLVAQELERTAPRSPHLTRVRASCVAAPPAP